VVQQIIASEMIRQICVHLGLVLSVAHNGK